MNLPEVLINAIGTAFINKSAHLLTEPNGFGFYLNGILYKVYRVNINSDVCRYWIESESGNSLIDIDSRLLDDNQNTEVKLYFDKCILLAHKKNIDKFRIDSKIFYTAFS